jgi:beta-1,2-xylosyltransferase
MMSADLDWRNAHRIRLHNFANNDSTAPTSFIAPDFSLSQAGSISPPNTDSQRVMSSSQERTEMTMETIPTEEASRFFYDMALAGEPIQCMEEDGTCGQLRYVACFSRWFEADARRDEIKWAPPQRSERLNQHKFLFDIDGNGWR